MRKKNHFLVVEKVIGNQVRLIDYGRKNPYLMTIPDFEKIWDGYVLVFRAPKESRKPQPDIHVDHLYHDFGDVQIYTLAKHVFIIKNLGTLPLELDNNPSCNCTKAILSKKVIPPGEQGQLEVHYDTSEYLGTRFVSVKLLSNDPDEPMILHLI